jgi:hypothetical protein
MRDPLWLLVDRVREASYDFFTLAEKSRMHKLVCKLKATKTVSPEDMEWLRQADANLCGIASLSATFRRRNGGAR